MMRYLAISSVCAGLVLVTARAQPSSGNRDTRPEQETRLGEGRPIVVERLGLEMRPLPAGTFLMGSPKNESGRFKDERQHEVTLTKPFWLGKTEVTEAQWIGVMGGNAQDQLRKAMETNNTNVRQITSGAIDGEVVNPGRALMNADDQSPMVYVSWTEAQAFCVKLTEQERIAGRLPVGYEYTLPTEAQWEYACRAATTDSSAGDLNAVAWYAGNSKNTTHRVDQKQSNPWGLADMHGNVEEWCSDWYGDYPKTSVRDPAGPTSGSWHVVRGGCWSARAENCRSAFRYAAAPSARGNTLGFRVALARD